MEANRVHSYTRKLGDHEIVIENIRPEFQSEEERSKARAGIAQLLYEVFSKYENTADPNATP